MLGTGEIAVLVALGVIALGWRKFPEALGSVGKSIKEFKKGLIGNDEKPSRDVTPKDSPKGLDDKK